MNSDTAQPGARRAGGLRRTVWRLLLLGLFALLLAAGWFCWGMIASGRLALAQPAPAPEIPKGFDFGPVWLEQGEAGRYFISAQIPDTQGAPWYTTFEILDSHKQPVQRQEDVRYIGDYQFQPGQRRTFSGTFTLAEQTGYYYFRFAAKNGTYPAQAAGPPVLQFSLRQRVVSGALLWAPTGGLLALALLCFAGAAALIGRLGSSGAARPVRPAESWSGQMTGGSQTV